ncbi:MAG: hypothetical protein LBR74_00900 [Eubacterium sp.]|nr:hypothetical protein [Eubacterium sp.]
MSLPTIPDVRVVYSIGDSISQILTSIAMEEIGLSHIINSEGEKLQYVLGTLSGAKGLNPTIPEILEVNESVKDMLDTVSTNQMFLFAKMSSALNAYFKNMSASNDGEACPNCPNNPSSVVIMTNKGKIHGSYIYLPQGVAAELSAFVITSGDKKVIWSNTDKPGVYFSSNNNKAFVKIDADAAVGPSIIIKASSAANGGKYDEKTVIIINSGIKDVVIGGDEKLYADYGDNTFKEINSNGTVTEDLICGGIDRTPGTEDDRDDVILSESGVKYLGPNADNSFQKAGPDGLLGTEDDQFIRKINENENIGPCNEAEHSSSIKDVPDAVTGRILSADKAGDNSDWVEIAQNGDFSLIVRKKYINISSAVDNYDKPDFQYTVFGVDNKYGNSTVRQKINKWFMNEASGNADNLDPNAALRRFTVKNTSLMSLGIGTAGEEGKEDSFSKPSVELAPSGIDVAFALSYSEAANFISKEYSWNGGNNTSVAAASSNFMELQIPDSSSVFDRIWLRSPGSDENMASDINRSGRVFQTKIDGSLNEFCLVCPALWVISTIFE